MFEFSRGLKSIRSALLNLVKLSPETRPTGLISGYISIHQLHASHFQFIMSTTILIKILKKLHFFVGRKAIRPPEKPGNVTLIHPMSYKSQFFIDEVLQCLVRRDWTSFGGLDHYEIYDPRKVRQI